MARSFSNSSSGAGALRRIAIEGIELQIGPHRPKAGKEVGITETRTVRMSLPLARTPVEAAPSESKSSPTYKKINRTNRTTRADFAVRPASPHFAVEPLPRVAGNAGTYRRKIRAVDVPYLRVPLDREPHVDPPLHCAACLGKPERQSSAAAEKIDHSDGVRPVV